MSDLKFWNPGRETTNVNISGLMGERITYLRQDGKRIPAIVAGVDPYIGVSIVYADEPSKICLCLHGPMDPNVREHYLYDEFLQSEYPTDFKTYVKYLREVVEGGGVFSREEFGRRRQEEQSYDGELSMGGPGICPYGV